MLKKRTLKNGVKVTFELDHLADADLVEVAGDWNDWQPEPMKKYKNGKHKLAVTFEPESEHQFLYRVDGDRWETDPDADRYVSNEYGGENSVVVASDDA